MGASWPFIASTVASATDQGENDPSLWLNDHEIGDSVNVNTTNSVVALVTGNVSIPSLNNSHIKRTQFETRGHMSQSDKCTALPNTGEKPFSLNTHPKRVVVKFEERKVCGSGVGM
ncbi:hypothetical protein RIF29_38154 [Crotalaria pallida]|uniref:Uncharacterized protein n=1 Tax=Crotalaria pallida TaxID=3830 RepID=A0AAN9HNN5_CROPI